MPNSKEPKLTTLPDNELVTPRQVMAFTTRVVPEERREDLAAPADCFRISIKCGT
jgi:hypothetical protein